MDIIQQYQEQLETTLAQFYRMAAIVKDYEKQSEDLRGMVRESLAQATLYSNAMSLQQFDNAKLVEYTVALEQYVLGTLSREALEVQAAKFKCYREERCADTQPSEESQND